MKIKEPSLCLPYTYAQRETVTAAVTFKVVNGAWNDKTTEDKVVVLTGYEGEKLRLKHSQIPKVGRKPAKSFKAGSWDVVPDNTTRITKDTTYTYTYRKTQMCKITFDANGGTGTMKAVRVKYGTEYTLPKCRFTAPSGKLFSSWDKGATGKKIKVTKDLTLKAKWKNIPVKRDYTFFAKLVSSGKTSLRLTWGKVYGADGYEVWLAECRKGSEFTQVNDDAAFKKIDDVNASKAQSCKITGLKNGGSYKAYVRAYKLDGKKRTYIGKRSELVHAIAGGSGKKMTNPACVSVKKPEVELNLSKTKSSTIRATVKGVNPSLKILDHGGGVLRFFSSNENIAKVDENGKITAVNAGECTVWVLTNNGIRAKVKVTVTR